MLEVTRTKLRAEKEQKRLADKPPPGVNPVLAKLLKTQAVKSASYAPKHPEIYSVTVDKKKTLSTGAQIATSRYAVQSQLDPVLTGKISYITDKYVDVERFRERYVHKIK